MCYLFTFFIFSIYVESIFVGVYLLLLLYNYCSYYYFPFKKCDADKKKSTLYVTQFLQRKKSVHIYAISFSDPPCFFSSLAWCYNIVRSYCGWLRLYDVILLVFPQNTGNPVCCIMWQYCWFVIFFLHYCAWSDTNCTNIWLVASSILCLNIIRSFKYQYF